MAMAVKPLRYRCYSVVDRTQPSNVTVRLDAQTFARFDAIARERDVTRNDLVREIIARFVAEQEERE
jgi:predicted transcriptional regulator